jgi:hypothetical protein
MKKKNMAGRLKISKFTVSNLVGFNTHLIKSGVGDGTSVCGATEPPPSLSVGGCSTDDPPPPPPKTNVLATCKPSS